MNPVNYLICMTDAAMLKVLVVILNKQDHILF